MKSVLFLCVHNAGRSQMAAAFARKLGGDALCVMSGGSEPIAAVHPVVAEVMMEIGVDVAAEQPRRFSDADIERADIIVTMGCGDACPIYPGKRYVDWELDDPAGKPIENVRRIRDEIKARVEELLATSVSA